ncbi:MAG: hypothetical protein R2727_03390 [Bacteroidales bacterium]
MKTSPPTWNSWKWPNPSIDLMPVVVPTGQPAANTAVGIGVGRQLRHAKWLCTRGEEEPATMDRPYKRVNIRSGSNELSSLLHDSRK